MEPIMQDCLFTALLPKKWHLFEKYSILQSITKRCHLFRLLFDLLANDAPRYLSYGSNKIAVFCFVYRGHLPSSRRDVLPIVLLFLRTNLNMQKSFLTTALLLALLFAGAQNKITGTIVDAQTKIPIRAASVFFSNTTKGTSSASNGEFTLDNVGYGRIDLVVSCVGYETFLQTIEPEKITAPLNIALKAKIEALDEVVVGGYTVEGWSVWGNFFVENFIGLTPYAANCKIKNPETIRFRNYKKQGVLKVFADESIVIENKSLGYIVHYSLESFQFDFNSRLLIYQGYPLFKSMETKRSGLKNRWKLNRQKVYYGSQMHFMRSLFRNKINEEGFEMRKLVKIKNTERQRVKALYASGVMAVGTNGNNAGNEKYKDSSRYFENILQQPAEKEIVYPTLLSGDSVGYYVNSITAGMQFSDYLHITYTKIKEDRSYLEHFHLNRVPVHPVSLVTLVNNSSIEILSNGFFYDGVDLFNSGYWSWSENLATLLPLDYWPDND